MEQQLNFLDENTLSRLLISTRIRGLVSGATEVQLSLLSPRESVEMLIYMSGVLADNAEASAELIKISDLCCRLPLTIGIAAGMLKSFGSDWQGHVLDMLQEDAGGSMADESENGMSPAETIVIRSVKELDCDTAELFTWMGVVPEDVPCPVSVVSLIWNSAQQNKEKTTKRLSLKIRKMTRNLLKYNLCLGTFEMGVFYHDIVRDVARGSIGNAEDIRRHQRHFVETAISAYDQSDQHVKDYMTLALPAHMAEAFLPASSADELLR